MFMSFLDNDLYKLLMSQFVWYYYPDIEVEYRFINRDSNDLFVGKEELKEEFDKIINTIPTNDELDYLKQLKHSTFYNSSEKKVFLDSYLKDLKKCTSEISSNLYRNSGTIMFSAIDSDDIQYSGPWWLAILYEVPFLATISELHTNNILNSLRSERKLEIGNKNIKNYLAHFARNDYSYSIRFSDFGTRRRSSSEGQEEAIFQCFHQLPDKNYNLGGTSNVYLARKYNLNPVGTFAHELPMVLAGIAGIDGKDRRETYRVLSDLWFSFYKGAYSILLPDTFGSYFLFDNYPEMVLAWEGIRHDSGDPYEFGDYYIKLCENYNIDPMNKVIVFSDSLDFDKMKDIFEYFKRRIWVTFGIGTKLTHCNGIKPPNIVIKANTAFKHDFGVKLVKLSDEKDKNTGSPYRIEQYKKIFNRNGEE